MTAVAKGTIPSFLITEKRDPRTGKVTSIQNYRMVAIRRDDYYEVPAHGGDWYHGVHNAELKTNRLSKEDCDRLGLSKLPRKVAPMTLDQQIAAKKEEIAKLDRELAARGAAPVETLESASAPVVVSEPTKVAEDPAKVAENDSLQKRLEEARIAKESQAPPAGEPQTEETKETMKPDTNSEFAGQLNNHRNDLKADNVVLGGDEKKFD